MTDLRMVSCMAPTMDPMVSAIAAYLRAELGVQIELHDKVDWRTRYALLDRGEVELAWVCGLPYVTKADRGQPYRLLAAPVMAGERYRGRPIYFSDVLVSSNSGIDTIQDLQGKRWAYNEPRSHSGYNAACYWLSEHDCTWDHFGAVYQAGKHSRALSWLAKGLIDGAAVDTTVLEWETRRRPELAQQLRAIDTLGPSPMPPWVVHARVPGEVRRALRNALCASVDRSDGGGLLVRNHLAGFTPVQDADYDLIRRWDQIARSFGKPNLAIDPNVITGESA